MFNQLWVSWTELTYKDSIPLGIPQSCLRTWGVIVRLRSRLHWGREDFLQREQSSCFPDPAVELLRAMQKMGHSCVVIYPGGQISPHCSFCPFLGCSPRTNLKGEAPGILELGYQLFKKSSRNVSCPAPGGFEVMGCYGSSPWRKGDLGPLRSWVQGQPSTWGMERRNFFSLSGSEKDPGTGCPEWALWSFLGNSVHCSINHCPSCRTPFETQAKSNYCLLPFYFYDLLFQQTFKCSYRLGVW